MKAYVKKMFKYIACFLLIVLVSLSLYDFIVINIMIKDYVNIFGILILFFDIGDIVIVKLDN